VKKSFNGGEEKRKRGDIGSRNEGRNSLRIGSGTGAQPQRRGSLKKRNRTAYKEAKEEAAIERKTVYLPEYVECKRPRQKWAYLH
jgi:hypothetical protein